MKNIPHVAPYGMEKDLHLVKGLRVQCFFTTLILPLRITFILAIQSNYIRPSVQLPKSPFFKPQQTTKTQLIFLCN